MPRPSRTLLVIGLALVALLALALGAEAVYRLRIAGSDGVPARIRYYHHARLSRAPVRDVDYGGAVHINRYGLRGPDFELEKAPGTTRIMVVGASTTFDACARSDAETWPARLEHWLETLAPGRDFEVINAGGLPMLDQVIRLQTELWRFEPDAIVMYAGHGIVSAADAFEPDPSDPTPDAAATVAPWDPWLRRHSRLYERLRPEWRNEVPTGLDDDDWRRAVDRAVRDFERDLTSFTLIARSLGSDVVFVEINRATGERDPSTFTEAERAAWTRLFPTPPEVVHAGYVRFDRVWQQVADSAGATYLPADRIGIIGPEHYCANDPIHFNRAGAEAMGQRLAEQLLAEGVL